MLGVIMVTVIYADCHV